MNGGNLMNYLFLDMEWNQLNNQFNLSEDEILEIAAVYVDKDLINDKTFFKIVKPEHIENVSKKTLTFLRLGINILEVALPIEIIVDKFIKKFSEFDIVVVWNRDTYDLFTNATKLCGITLPKHKVIVLQELLSDIDQFMGFEAALRRYFVKYKPNLLHCSKYDVTYLKRLFYSIIFQYKQQCKVDSKNKAGRLSNSNIIHNLKCHYIVGKSSFHHSSYVDIFSGYKLCKYCIGTEKHVLLPKELFFDRLDEINNFSEERINAFCKRFDMKCNFSDGLIFVRTHMATWRIYHDGEKVLNIYHENYRKVEQTKKKKKSNEGYHIQNVKCDNLYDVLNYIHRHDKNFLCEKKIKRNRIDMLLGMLEKERAEKNIS